MREKISYKTLAKKLKSVSLVNELNSEFKENSLSIQLVVSRQTVKSIMSFNRKPITNKTTKFIFISIVVKRFKLRAHP